MARAKVKGAALLVIWAVVTLPVWLPVLLIVCHL
jgi:hypothetical protein